MYSRSAHQLITGVGGSRPSRMAITFSAHRRAIAFLVATVPIRGAAGGRCSAAPAARRAGAARPRRHPARPRRDGRAQRIDQGSRVDHRTATGVHQDRPSLHGRKGPCVDHVSGLGGEGHVEADEVGGGQEILEFAALGARRRRGVRAGRERQLHVEAAEQLRDAPGDTSEAHQPDGRAGQLTPEKAPPRVPSTGRRGPLRRPRRSAVRRPASRPPRAPP